MTSQDGQPHPTPDETPTPADTAPADALAPDDLAIPDAPDAGGPPADTLSNSAMPAADALSEDDAIGWVRPNVGSDHAGALTGAEGVATDAAATTDTADHSPADEPAVENAFVGDVEGDGGHEHYAIPPLAADAAAEIAAATSTFPRLAAAITTTEEDPTAADPHADSSAAVGDARTGRTESADGPVDGPSGGAAGTPHMAIVTDEPPDDARAPTVPVLDVSGSYQAHFLEGGEDEPEYVAHVSPTSPPASPSEAARATTPAATAVAEATPPAEPVAAATPPEPMPAAAPDALPPASFVRRRKPRKPAAPPHHRVPAVSSGPILDALAADGEPADSTATTARITADSPDAVGEPVMDDAASDDAASDDQIGEPTADALPTDAADVAAEGSDDAVAALDAAEDAEDAADARDEHEHDHGPGHERDHEHDHDHEDALAGAGATGGGWTIPLLCAGVAVIACCLVIPQADANRRLAYERAALRADLEAVQTQVATNDEFLRKLAGDPTLAERLAHRQLNLQRPGTRVLPIRHGEPGTSPFDLVQVPPPPQMDPYEPLGGRLAAVCRNARTRLYTMGAGLFLLAAGLVLGASGRERTAAGTLP